MSLYIVTSQGFLLKPLVHQTQYLFSVQILEGLPHHDFTNLPFIDRRGNAVYEAVEMDHDVSSLVMSVLSAGGRDDFGEEESQRTVPLLDRIIESPRTLGSRLLELPVEILAETINLMAGDRSSLANLALVNVECRQMARSAQFTTVRYDYSPRSMGFFASF